LFGSQPLSGMQWLLIWVAALSIFFIVEAEKALWRRLSK
jgi:hypothetical protein